MNHRLRMAHAAATADAFLASFPKSGRTWFRFILSNYFAFARTEPGDQTGADLFSMFGIIPNYALDPVRGVPAFRYWSQRPEVPLVLVSHYEYHWLRFLNRPVIFMVRDPRDVMVSGFFHASRHKQRFNDTIDVFIRDSKRGTPALIAYLNGWASGLQRRRSEVLSYEELTRDAVRVTARVLRFLGREPDKATLAKAVSAASFDAMRELEMQSGLPSHRYERSDVESLRTRRGKVGGYAEYLDSDQISYIETACERGLSQSAKKLVALTGMQLI